MGYGRAYQNEGRVFAVEGIALVDLGHGGVDAVGGRGRRLVGDVDAEEGIVLTRWLSARDALKILGKVCVGRDGRTHEVVVHEVHPAICAGARGPVDGAR